MYIICAQARLVGGMHAALLGRGAGIHGFGSLKWGSLCMAGAWAICGRGAAVAELCCGQYCQRACGALVVVVWSLSSSLW